MQKNTAIAAAIVTTNPTPRTHRPAGAVATSEKEGKLMIEKYQASRSTTNNKYVHLKPQSASIKENYINTTNRHQPVLNNYMMEQQEKSQSIESISANSLKPSKSLVKQPSKQ